MPITARARRTLADRADPGSPAPGDRTATDPSPGSGATTMRISDTPSGLASALWQTYVATLDAYVRQRHQNRLRPVPGCGRDVSAAAGHEHVQILMSD